MEPNQQQPNPTPEPPVIPDQTEDDEWTGAEAAFVLDKGVNLNPAEEPRKDEQTKPGEGGQEQGTPKSDPEGKKSDEEQGAGDDAKANSGGSEKTAEPADNPAIREARSVQRELTADKEAVVSDIKEVMFADAKTELTDADGDPIRTIEDVQKHLNPSTGKPFTDVEAAAWLLAAQKNLAEENAKVDKEAEQIAEVNLDLKDQADSVRAKWKDLLAQLDKEEPGFSTKLFRDYAATLVRDEQTQIITKAPVKMADFYESALRGYAKAADLAAKQAEEVAKQQTQQRQQQHQQTRSDRSDIYTGGKTDQLSGEEKEWAEAEKMVYGN